MADKWADFSFARPDLAQLKAEGYAGVIRYVSPDVPSTHGKILFTTEKDNILSAGLDLLLNFEWYEGRCNEGANAGYDDAVTAMASATLLGYPKGKCIYFSHDIDTYDWPKIDAYFRAIHTELDGHYLVGAYGSYELVKHLLDANLIDRAWQTTAWSGGLREPRAGIYQNGYRGDIDINEVTRTDIGSWLENNPTQEEEIMTPQEHQWLIDTATKMQKVSYAMDNTVGPAVGAIRTVVQDIDKRVASLQATVAALNPVGPNPVDINLLATAMVDEMLKRIPR